MKQGDTIVAISTGASLGAIAIVRMSGKDAIRIADGIFCAKNGECPSAFPARQLTLGTVSTTAFFEQAMCVVFRAPLSYTGEDLVEFQCHGGKEIPRQICSECIKRGARLADAGEFSRIAFLNGKMSLAEAEGMIDMIQAESEAEVRAGYSLLSGKLGQISAEIQAELTDIMAEIEVSFDYPEETIEYITKAGISSRLEGVKVKIEELLSTASTGRLIKNGINVLILGKPNVGKSSLLNALLGEDKAIVTNIAGTTRDTVEGTLSLGGVKVNLIDTAGIRDAHDAIEKIGVERAKSLIKQADITLFLVDGSSPHSFEDDGIFKLLNGKRHIAVKTKADLPQKCNKSFGGEILVSSLTGLGLDELKSEILRLTEADNIPQNGLIITNERHKNALLRSGESIKNALGGLAENSLDLVAVDIKQAYLETGEITGNTASEEIINQIFEKFCLGK